MTCEASSFMQGRRSFCFLLAKGASSWAREVIPANNIPTCGPFPLGDAQSWCLTDACYSAVMALSVLLLILLRDRTRG